MRYSLRGMLLVITLLAICLAVWPSTARKQQVAVGALRRQPDVLDVLYEHEIQRDASGAVVAKLGPTNVNSDVPPWMIRLVGVDVFHDAICVWLVDGCSQTTLRHLTQMPRLQEVYCVDCTPHELRQVAAALPAVTVVE